jgi:hypothetical protein
MIIDTRTASSTSRPFSPDDAAVLVAGDRRGRELAA